MNANHRIHAVCGYQIKHEEKLVSSGHALRTQARATVKTQLMRIMAPGILASGAWFSAVGTGAVGLADEGAIAVDKLFVNEEIAFDAEADALAMAEDAAAVAELTASLADEAAALASDATDEAPALASDATDDAAALASDATEDADAAASDAALDAAPAALVAASDAEAAALPTAPVAVLAAPAMVFPTPDVTLAAALVASGMLAMTTTGVPLLVVV